MAVAEEKSAGIPEWVVTFGDMMSLLLTFFVMLFSMSEMRQEQKFQAVLDSLRRQFGYDSAAIAPMPGTSKPRNAAIAKLASLGRARRMNTMRGGAKVRAPVGEYRRVQSLQRDKDQTRAGVVYFKEAGSELTEEDKRALQNVAQEIAGMPQKIEIRGHTSTRPLPPDSHYRNHWDLSYARAFKTMEFLISLGIDPMRIRIVAAGQYEPKHIRDDILLQEKNPRVEVVMLNELAKDLQGTKEEKSKRLSAEGAL